MLRGEEDDARGVEQLRQEVAFLRREVDIIRSNMQDMHREVGSAVLLLSRFIGLEWNTDEAIRLAEEKTASASEAVDRLDDNVGTLEQQMTVTEESKIGGREGVAVSGGDALAPRASLACAITATQESLFTETGGSGSSGSGRGDSTPRGVAEDNLLSASSSSPSSPRHRNVGLSISIGGVVAQCRGEDAEDENASDGYDAGKRTHNRPPLDATGEEGDSLLSLFQTEGIGECKKEPPATLLSPLTKAQGSSVAMDEGDVSDVITASAGAITVAPLLQGKEQAAPLGGGSLVFVCESTDNRRVGMGSDGSLANSTWRQGKQRQICDGDSAVPAMALEKVNSTGMTQNETKRSCRGEESAPEGKGRSRDDGFDMPPFGEEEANAGKSTKSALEHSGPALRGFAARAGEASDLNCSVGQVSAKNSMGGGRERHAREVDEDKFLSWADGAKTSQATQGRESQVHTSSPSETVLARVEDAIFTTPREGTLVAIQGNGGVDQKSGGERDKGEASKPRSAETNIATACPVVRQIRPTSGSSGGFRASIGDMPSLAQKAGMTQNEDDRKDEKVDRHGGYGEGEIRSNTTGSANDNKASQGIRESGDETISAIEQRGRSISLGSLESRPSQVCMPIKLAPAEPRSMGGGQADRATEASEARKSVEASRGNESHAEEGWESGTPNETHRISTSASRDGGGGIQSRSPSRNRPTEGAAAAMMEDLNSNTGGIGASKSGGGGGGERGFSDDCSQTTSGSSFTSFTTTTGDPQESSYSELSTTTTSASCSSSSGTMVSSGGSSRRQRRSSSASRKENVKEVVSAVVGGSRESARVGSGLSGATVDRAKHEE